MPARRSPTMTMAAPTSSAARILIASSTLCSGRTLTTRAGFARSSSATVFMSGLLRHCDWKFGPSHVGIVRAAAPFGHDPLDVLPRVLDVAGLAVHAVLGVDLQPRGGAFL